MFFSRSYENRLLDKRFPLATKTSFPTTIFLNDRDCSFLLFFCRHVTLGRKREETIIEGFNVSDQCVLWRLSGTVSRFYVVTLLPRSLTRRIDTATIAAYNFDPCLKK